MNSNESTTNEPTTLREKFDEYAPAVIGTVATITGVLLARSYIRRNKAMTSLYKLDLVERVEWRKAREAWEKQIQK